MLKFYFDCSTVLGFLKLYVNTGLYFSWTSAPLLTSGWRLLLNVELIDFFLHQTKNINWVVHTFCLFWSVCNCQPDQFFGPHDCC